MSDHKTTLRLDEDLLESVRIAVAKRRMRSFQQAVEEALRAWVGQRPTSDKTVVKTEQDNERWHAMLDEILADPEERIGIQKNLEWAAHHVRTKIRPTNKLTVG